MLEVAFWELAWQPRAGVAPWEVYVGASELQDGIRESYMSTAIG